MWFELGLKEAIKQHKEQNKILLLLVEGPDKHKCDYLEECIIKLDTAEYPNITAVKLALNSQENLDFQNLYANLEFSCLIFLGENGVPVKIVSIPKDQFNRDKIFLKISDMANYCNCISETYKYHTDQKKILSEEESIHIFNTHIELNMQDNKNLVARIQFKLPDGSARFQNFRCNATVEDMRIFILENVKPVYKFDLATMHPFRVLPLDSTETFLQMDLYPSAVIFLLPKKKTGTIVLLDKTMNMFWGFFFWFVNVFRNISNTFSWIYERSSNWLRHVFRRRQSGSGQQRHVRTLYGNVHTLSSDDNDDNDQNTYNGNSTQQK